ncbi:MAG: PAS domain S-box protein [Gammaproteobacteria bacterium]|nr:PAS domain S-box protein [Gammaproteobacteria bacterium]
MTPPEYEDLPEDGELLRLALDLAPAAIVVVDDAGRVVLVNRETEQLFGYQREELLGRPVEELVPQGFRLTHPGHRSAFMTAPESRPMGKGRDLFARRKDGTEVPVEIGLNPVTTSRGKLVVTSVFDLTERKRAEARFQAVVEGSPSGMLMVERHGTIVLANREAARTFGYGVDELVGQPIEKLVPRRFTGAHPMHRTSYLDAPEARRMGTGRELFGVRKDGTEVPLEGTFVLASVVDISMRRTLENQLREAQRLETVGALASGIAHDFNNVLLAILGYSELVLEEPGLAEATREDMGQIVTAAERGRRVVERMLEVGRRRNGTPAATRLHEPVREAMELLRASMLKSVDVRLHFDEAAPPVFCDGTQIHQIMMNLGSNAARAIDRSDGMLEVNLVPFRADQDAARELPALLPGLYARLTVADNGVGMPPEVAERVYEPFYTSRRSGEGTGLGLWLVQELVQGMRGFIDMKTAPDQGTVFDIYLPAAEQRSDGVAPEDVGSGADSRPHVLYVEDEAPLAELGRRRLERAGYRVSMFTSSIQALESIRSSPESVDLLVTDNTMPRMSGLELAEEATRIRPALPVLMVSGLARMRLEDVPEFITRVLPKPHSGDELIRVVAELMQPGGQPG